MEFVILMVALAVGVIFGWNLREVHAKRVVNNVMADLKEKAKENSIKIKIEKNNGHLYVFNAEDDSFMGQGDTFAIVDKLLSEKYPGKKFLISEENVKEVGLEL